MDLLRRGFTLRHKEDSATSPPLLYSAISAGGGGKGGRVKKSKFVEHAKNFYHSVKARVGPVITFFTG